MRSSLGVRRADVVIWCLAVLFLLQAATRDAAAADLSGASVYATECGSCHVAFPSGLLRPAEWARVLGALDRHYGVDASLDPTTTAAIARQLGSGAIPKPTVGAQALPRITSTGWFREEHDEVAVSAWASPAVKRASNCEACHADAARGRFDEHSVRVPN